MLLHTYQPSRIPLDCPGIDHLSRDFNILASYNVYVMFAIFQSFVSLVYTSNIDGFRGVGGSEPLKNTRRSVEHCTLHADGAWLNELG